MPNLRRVKDAGLFRASLRLPKSLHCRPRCIRLMQRRSSNRRRVRRA
jgi:hypothetical protein